MLRCYNKLAFQESNKAREIEEDVILALTGLRSDLQQKIKEIKNLSGDFKNAVDREMATTRKAVDNLQDVLGQTELDPSLTTGKQDPYLLRLAVDRQLERQIDEENYLHQVTLSRFTAPSPILTSARHTLTLKPRAASWSRSSSGRFRSRTMPTPES
jgi:hypothetical protein